ncbi:MAG: hypothetical protein ACI8RD_003505 [Bacillariaceae sp.]|jgi:hypothetical protein
MHGNMEKSISHTSSGIAYDIPALPLRISFDRRGIDEDQQHGCAKTASKSLETTGFRIRTIR